MKRDGVVGIILFGWIVLLAVVVGGVSALSLDTTPPQITILSPPNATIADGAPDLNLTTDESSDITYTWDGEGNITGCQNCTSYLTTYGEYANTSDQNLVGQWHFNENYGTISTDDSNSGNDGTITGAAWTVGKFGNALSFDGNDNVAVPDDPSLDGMNTGLTISVWVKSPSSSVEEGLVNKFVGKSSTNIDDAYLLRLSSGIPRVQLATGDSWEWSAQGSIAVDDNTWHHIVYVWDRPTSYLYVDGVYDSGATYTTFDFTLNNISDPLYVGAININGAFGNYFTGTIDEVAIWNSVLPADEIYDLYSKHLEDDQHNVTVYANDTAGNMNSSTRWFSVNPTPPNITITSPSNTTYNIADIDFDLTSSEPLDANAGVLVYNIDENTGTLWVPLVSDTPTHWYNNTVPYFQEGQYKAVFIVKDISGNPANETVYFTIALPDIYVDPIEMNIILNRGEIENRTLTIGNDGIGLLEWNITLLGGVLGGASESQYLKTTVPKPENIIFDSSILKYEHKPGELLVKYAGNSSLSDLGEFYGSQNAEFIKEYPEIGWHLIRVSDEANLNKTLYATFNSPLIEKAEPNYIFKTLDVPDDSRFNELWGMHNTGQTGGTSDADIDALEAWDIYTGDRSVVVAVIDTGVDYTHEDLVVNMWTNTGEIPGNGIDDDGNGFIDDYYGWDFAYDDNNPMDGHSHGTHVSGTIGGVGDNGLGVAGVSWKVKIMAVKFLTDGGSGYTSDAIDSINYATMMGADIMSNSWGGGGYSSALGAAIQRADDAGILFVAAAGNSATDTDVYPNYPSGYDIPNVMSIAATDHNDALASFSNYGDETVDLGAPGVSILSSIPGNSYTSYSGTSMATPHVSGAAALLKAYHPGLTHLEIKDILMNSVDPIPSLEGKTVAGGRLNIYKAIFSVVPTWISVTPINGTVEIGNQTNVTITINATGLKNGTYKANIRIDSTDPDETPFVQVTLDVVIPPTVTIYSPQTTTSDTTPDLNVEIDKWVSVTYTWDDEGNITGCQNCTTYSTTYGESTLDADMALLMHLNEDFGSTTYDDSPNDNDGTILGPAWTSYGRFGNALSFDGVDDFVSVPYDASLNIANTLTFGAWIYPDYDSPPNGPGPFFITKGKGYAIGIPFGEIRTFLYINGKWIGHKSKTSVPMRQWSYVFATYNGTTVKMYLNGMEVYSGPQTGDINTANTKGLKVGWCGGHKRFKGIIDEVQVFDRVLNTSEIAQSYNKSLLPDDLHSVTVYANDTAGNINSSTVWFTVDITPPGITIHSPKNITYSTDSIDFNVSADEIVDTWTYSLDGGNNVTFIPNITLITPGDNWWNSSWQYRQVIKITNNNDSAVLQEGYTANITLNTTQLVLDGKMNPAGNDARIVWYNSASGEHIELDRLNLSAFNKTDGTNTAIVFKLQENVSAGGFDANYSLYYGNPAAGAASGNGSNVYLFYDHFTSDTRSEYNSTGVDPIYWDGVSEYYDGQGGTADGSTVRAYHVGTELDPTKYVFIARVKVGTNTYDRSGLIFGYENDSSRYFVDLNVYKSKVTFLGHGISETDLCSMSTATWYELGVSHNGTEWIISKDGIFCGAVTQTDPHTSGSVGFLLRYQSGSRIDYILVRKYLSPEPITSLGGEEIRLGDGPHTITVYASDTSGNMNSSTVWFSIDDTTPPQITILSPPNATIADGAPDLNLTTDESSDITYTWDGEGNITGCQSCTSYLTTYGEYANTSDQNLVGLWHLNENYGTISTDDSNNGNDGTITGAAWTAGKFGNALEFDGSDDYVDVGLGWDTIIKAEESFTLGAWIKTTSTSRGSILDFSYHANDQHLYLFVSASTDLNGAGQIAYGGEGDGNTNDDIEFTNMATPINNGVWHHVVYVHTPTIESIYVDGSLIDDHSVTTAGSYITSTQNAYIGRTYYAAGNPTGWERPFNGTIDEVAIYNRALSADEIYDLYSKHLENDLHNVTVYANDTAGNMSSSTRWFSVSIDTTLPQITILSPENKTYTTTSIDLNVSASENIDTWMYSLNGGNNVTFIPNITLEENWWNSSWQYRQVINITNNNDSVVLQEGYTVNIALNTTQFVLDGKMNPTGNDARIVWYNSTSGQNVELDRLNLSAFNKTDGTNTAIVFKLQENISAGGFDANYSLYYSNPSAGAPKDNGSNVYLFYDDFSTDTTADYTWEEWGSGSSGTFAWSSNYGGSIRLNAPDNTGVLVSPNSVSVKDVMVEVDIRSNSAPDGNGVITVRTRLQDKDNSYSFYYANADYVSPRIELIEIGVYNTLTSGSEYISLNTWYSWKVANWGENLKFLVDGVEKLNTTDPTFNTAQNIGLEAREMDGYFDNLRVRKYLSPEPTTSLGGEEIRLSDGPHTITVYANDTSGNMNLSTRWFSVEFGGQATLGKERTGYYGGGGGSGGGSMDENKTPIPNMIAEVDDNIWNVSKKTDDGSYLIDSITSELTRSSLEIMPLDKNDKNFKNRKVAIKEYSALPEGVGGVGIPDDEGFLGVFISADIKTVFNEIGWVVITVSYTDEELEDRGLDEDSLDMAWYDEENGGWITLSKGNPEWVNSIGINKEENYVWVNTSHLSLYGVIGELIPEASITSPVTASPSSDLLEIKEMLQNQMTMIQKQTEMIEEQSKLLQKIHDQLEALKNMMKTALKILRLG